MAERLLRTLQGNHFRTFYTQPDHIDKVKHSGITAFICLSLVNEVYQNTQKGGLEQKCKVGSPNTA